MKTKIEKGLKYLAAAIFLLALAVNVKVTLDDPFAVIENLAIASTSGGSSSGTDGFYSTGESTHNTCLHHTETKTVKEYKWYVSGEIVWAKFKPSASASGGYESREVQETTEFYGSEYKCPGSSGSCYVKFCYITD